MYLQTIYVYVIGRFPVVFGINSASSAVFEGSKIARSVAECYFPFKTACENYLSRILQGTDDLLLINLSSSQGYYPVSSCVTEQSMIAITDISIDE